MRGVPRCFRAASSRPNVKRHPTHFRCSVTLGAGAASALAAMLVLGDAPPPHGQSAPRDEWANAPTSEAIECHEAIECAVAAPAATVRAEVLPTARRSPCPVGIVQVRAIDHADERPVSAFAWALRGDALLAPGCDVAASGVALGYTADLRVPVGGLVAVSVEAEGYARSLPIDVSLAPGVTLRVVVARVVAAAPGR